MFGRKKNKQVELKSKIEYDSAKNEYSYEGHTISVKESSPGTYQIMIDRGVLYFSSIEFKMLFIYFSALFKAVTKK